jgi:hypothetical protein
MFRQRVFISFLISLQLAGCGLKKRTVSDQGDGAFYTDSSGQRLHWPEGSKIIFSLSSNFPEEWRSAFEGATGAYNDLFLKLRLEVAPTPNTAPEPKNGDPNSVSGDGVNGVYVLGGVWPWKDKDPHSDAMTVVTFSDSGIREADIFFRESSFSTGGTYVAGSPQTSSSSVQWIYMIAIHELGHALGRVHTDQPDSIMNPTVSISNIAEPFTTWDRQMFSEIYQIR